MSDIFKELQSKHGSEVVWAEGPTCFFAMGDNMGEEDSDRAISLEDGNFITWMGYGDEIINSIEVKEIDKLTKEQIDILKQFTGSNCYTREEW